MRTEEYKIYEIIDEDRKYDGEENDLLRTTRKNIEQEWNSYNQQWKERNTIV